MTPRKILCVDDQRSVHTIVASVLEPLTRNGTELVHAWDGLEALKQLVEHADVDAVILDINMPVLNGLAFLEQKSRTPFASIPVVIISSEGDARAEVEHAINLGAATVLSKSFLAPQLLACIRDLPDQQHA